MSTDKNVTVRAKVRKPGRPPRIPQFSLRTASRKIRTAYNKLYRFFYRLHPEYKIKDPKAADALDLIRYVYEHSVEINRSRRPWPYPTIFEGYTKTGKPVKLDLRPYLTLKQRKGKQAS